jgi:hypothetical protein
MEGRAMKVAGMLLTLYLAVTLANLGLALLFILSLIGLAVSLITKPGETIILIFGSFMWWLLGSYPLAAIALILLGVIAGALTKDKKDAPAGK